MNKILKRLLTGVLTLATVFTALPTTAVHAAETQYWTESEERVGIVEKVMNDGSIGSTFNEGHMTVEGEDAYCIDINTGFKNGYKTRSDASTRMTAYQIEDVALSLEYVKQYTKSHTGLSSQHAYLLRQLVVWQRLSVHLGWSCDNVRASYDEISKSVQDEVFAGAKAFVRENKGRYDCYGYIYTGEGQDLGQFFAELAVGNGKIQKSSSNTTVTNGNDCYSLSGATYGVYSDKGCTKSVATLTTNANGNTDTVELRAATYYVKETKAPKGFQLDKNVYTMTVKVNETTTLKVSDKPKVTDTLVELFKIDMEISKATPQGNASLEGAEFVWKYYDGYYTKDNLPSEPTRTWTTKTIAEKDSNNEVHYITRLADSYKVLVCVLATLFYRRFQYDRVKHLFHRQKLARMLLENGWYESESTQDSGFFKDLPATTKKEKITYFPKLYYRMEHGLLYIRTEITLGKYQDQLLHLEKKLETGLYCELVSKELKDSYVEYVLLYDTIANRITINEVQAEHGSLRLMKNVWWEYDKLPHMLIAGGTGGGKTYFILTIIEALLRSNAVMYILDPKNADLADLSVVMPEVWYKKDDITACIDRFYDGMMARSEAMKLMENYRTGENYAYLGLSPHFLIFDEYVAFMEMLTTKENAAVLNKLKQIVMLGRQAGYFLILACQRPDAKYLGDGIRDQFNFRVALGRMSELGYSMMFGEVDKDFFLKQIKGRGYVDTGNSVISEFYTPLVPKGHDFLKEIGRLSQNRQDGQAACGAKDAGTD